MADIVSTTFETRGGSGTVTISHSSLPNPSSETMRLSDIGKIKVEFDMEEEVDKNASSLYFIPQKFIFKAFDGLSGGSSLFQLIDDNLLSTDEIDVTLDFTTDAGYSWSDDTTFTKNDIKYNRWNREVEFNTFHALEPFTTLISDVFFTYQGDVYTFNEGSGSGTRDCMAASEFIENVLTSIDSSSTIINTSNIFSDNPFVSGNDTWVVFKDHDGSVFKQTDNALNALYRLAAVDGSVVGKAMGYNFFSNRLDNSDKITIQESDVVGGKDGITINPGLQNYRALSMWATSVLGTTGVLNWGSHYFKFGDSDGLNSDASKELHGLFLMLELQPASWNGTSFDDDGYATFNDTGADVSEDVVEGSYIVPVNANPSLSNGDHIWFSDKRELYEVDNADADRIILKTPMRRDLSAQFSTGGNKGVFEEIGATRENLAFGATNSYVSAYGADGTRRIELELFDIDLLNPYQTFTCGTSFPSVLQGLSFRPSNIEYDLVADRIKIEAYQIA